MIAKSKDQPIVLPADTPAAFGYRRVSDPKQEATGYGIDAQDKQIRDYYERHLKPAGYVWGGDFVDAAVSARKHHFLKRAAGDRLNMTVRKGDCIIIAKFDRGFRSIQDFANTTAQWDRRGIGFAIVAQGWQTWGGARSVYDKALLGMSAVFAELESDLISIRTKEGMAAKKARGEHVAGRPPIGKKRFGKKLIDDPNDRKVCRLIVELRDTGYSIYAVFSHLRKHGITRSNGREWSFDMVRDAYPVEKQRMHEERLPARPTDRNCV